MADVVTGLGGPGQKLAEIDRAIAITDLQLQAAQVLESLTESLPQILETVSTMKTDLKGDPVKLSDFVDVHQSAGEFPYIDVKAPRSGDLTSSPADVIATGVEAQENLTTLAESLTSDFKAFADHQSGLLSGLKKLQAGLEQGSELFGKTETAIKRLEQGAELFGHLLDGEISDDKLMEAFTNHLTMLTDVLKPLTDSIPGLSDFFQAYVDGVKSMEKNVEQLRQHGLDQEHVLDIWGDTFNANDPSVTSTTAPATAGTTAPSHSPIPGLEARLIDLRTQRSTVSDQWNATVNAMSAEELKNLRIEANKRLAAEKVQLAADGLTSLTPAESAAARDELRRLEAARAAALTKDDGAAEVRALDEKIRVAQATLAADDDSDRLEQHMVNVLNDRWYTYGPMDLDYLIENVGGRVGRTAAELRKKLPEGSAAGAVLLHQDTESQANPLERFMSSLFSSPRMAGLGLLGLVAVTIVGFLLFGGGDEEPDLIAAGDDAPATATAAVTPSSEATVTDEPTATATEEVVFGELAPQHFSICTDGTVLSGTVKVDANGEPVLDAEGNTINADTGESFVCR